MAKGLRSGVRGNASVFAAASTTELVRRVVPRAVRNALRRPRLTLTWLVDQAAFRLGRTGTCALREGWTVSVHPASVVPFQLHRDEQELVREMDAFVTLCRSGMVLLDVGAHFGVFTLAALHYGGGTARVIAVEPSAEARRVLEANVRLAGAADRVVILEAAAGDRDGEVAMLTTGPIAAHYMIGVDTDRPDLTRIPQLTISSIVSRTGLVPTHVKIDVEGFEGEVNEGGGAVLARHHPIVLLELHGKLVRERGRDPRAVLAKLEALGYRRFERSGQRIETAAAANLDIVRLACFA